ncbi:hypothetical protein [Geothrix oryzisoli]|uniref:hypothetical protein n=1 Tax=Geothrix oryzisoli TaxID=2922721 RepID=UPI001FAE6589|nr:hypothetical protein [Geothrix oryzisoli]
MDQNPYAGPNAVVADPQGEGTNTQDVARAQRLLLLSILASLVGNILMKTDTLIGLLVIPVALAVAVFSIWCVYKLCKALSLGPVLWIIAMFIPLINLICLVILNQKATTYLKSQGLKVGLLGAKV